MNIVVAVTGSIAAYKAVELVNQLGKAGHDVRVIMTHHATDFVQPMTFEAISHNNVITTMFSEKAVALEHITLAKWADVCIVAPADANIIAKMAHGLADDFLSTFILAFDGPVLVAPAMNTVMYHQSVTQDNLMRLRSLGFEIVAPANGKLACGDVGDGKLADVNLLLYRLEKVMTKQSLKGFKLIVTAGPTIGRIDPVRFVTNHSSGKMGFSIAKEATLRGADVTLVAGSVQRDTPFDVQRVDVATTEEMLHTLEKLVPEADGLIMAAAPADYVPNEYHEEKIKKTGDQLSLIFKKNPDILKTLKPLLEDKIVIGFAAESHQLLENAQRKLTEKHLDFIVANNIAGENSAFRSDYNAATIIFKDGHQEVVPKQLKTQLAAKILDELEHIHLQKEER
ncbi:MAG: bifunctional phosphopantothenoylcysteine decarboxylase/phosphopantothenate--cysteine ligase CoaBC [Peptococcaceae bacterium]|nr:bifunctional phosphopantothenoylcysteine decarboxylase/phosphopantothenate--cysteine ligase CoaBC [Peptococcaceae bacterium]